MAVKEPKITTVLQMHLNGGSKFSSRIDKVFVDGVYFGVTLHEATNGSPHHKYTARELHYGQDTYDLMKSAEENGTDHINWILSYWTLSQLRK